MGSPWKASDTTSPLSRRDDIKHRRKAQHSPYRPSSELLSSSVWDEFSRLYINEDRSFRDQLDEQVAEQERLHKEALALAAAEHERVRESAERARERVELEMARELKRREEEDIRALEAERQQAAERDAAERQRRREELQRQEEEQKRRAAEQRDIEARQTRLAEQERQNEADAARKQSEREEAERKLKEQSSAANKAQPTATAPTPSVEAAQAPAASLTSQSRQAVQTAQNGPSPHAASSTPQANIQPTAPQQPTAPASAPVSATTSAPALSPFSAPAAATREAQHQKYLDLHQRLKEMRKYVLAESKKMPALKTQLGEWRRSLKVLVGQFTAERENNRKPQQTLIALLRTAQQHAEPSIDVSSYVISSQADGSPMPMSGPLVYLLNILSKNIVTQLISEPAAIAEPLGVMAVSTFAQKGFKVNGTISLIDILLAKYHACCPVLWGIYGNEKTEKGRARIGWWKEEGKDRGDWESEQRHSERMAGLGRGYAAISLRDFSKSANENPYPPSNYWKTISYIVNVPPSEAQPTHFYVLKALIEGYIPRFVGFYGLAALAALRKALIEFPTQAPNGPARNAVMIMPQQIERDLKLTL